jgi:hypothetical protein
MRTKYNKSLNLKVVGCNIILCERNTYIFDVQVTVHRDKFLIIKPTRWTNFSNLCLESNSTGFGQFLCPSLGVFHCTQSNGICHTGLRTAMPAGSGWNCVPHWSCSQAVSKPVWHIPLLCVQWKTSNDGQRNCPKHVEFHFKHKFEKSVHIVAFITRNKYIVI